MHHFQFSLTTITVTKNRHGNEHSQLIPYFTMQLIVIAY